MTKIFSRAAEPILRVAPLLRATLTAALVSAALMLTGTLASPQGGAQQPTTCPAGTTLSADGTLCLSDAVDDNVVTTTTCVQGVLSEDGTRCIVPRLDAAPAPDAGAVGDGEGDDAAAPIPSFTG